MNLPARIEETRACCQRALSTSPLVEASGYLSRVGLPPDRRVLLRESGRLQRCAPELVAVRNAALRDGLPQESYTFERTLLVQTALSVLDEVSILPVDESVKHLFCREFAFYANPPELALAKFNSDGKVFPAMSAIVTLSRFPAGQHHWVVSGFPRSWFLKVAPRQIPHLTYFLAARMGGLAPYFVPHINPTTFSGAFLTEREYLKAFYRMSAAIEKQPLIRGIMAGSWMHSRETHRVSPHLEFLNRTYLEAGGVYLDRGLADSAEGFLTGDPARTRLYESGDYKPTFGLVFCTRGQAVAWKHAHADLEQLLTVPG